MMGNHSEDYRVEAIGAMLQRLMVHKYLLLMKEDIQFATRCVV